MVSSEGECRNVGGKKFIVALHDWKSELSLEEVKNATEEKIREKFGLVGNVENDLPKVAHSFRNGMIKARDWKYRIEHNTTSDKIEMENEKMLSWFRNEVEPLVTILLDLAHQYQASYGDKGLRDFAIENNFLDVLENRF